MALEAGVQGIVLSNHGGRQLDNARSGLENLVDIVAALKTRGPWPNPRFSVFVDGGVRRASDVLKAPALGASAVCPMFSRILGLTVIDLGWNRTRIPLRLLVIWTGRSRESYRDPPGMAIRDKARFHIDVEQDEFEMNMRLLGVTNINEITPDLVDASRLGSGATPQDNLYSATC